MRSLGEAVEWLRPLVDSKAWDYCVVWKLGDDPSRFFQWLGCCCSGGDVDSKGHGWIKEERLELPLDQICRDGSSQHFIRTRACEALARFPSSMELYSGVHGEVVLSNQPRWIVHDNSDHLTGTQVLIPVLGGLIELFTAKNIPQDQNIIKLVMAEFLGVQFLSFIPEEQALPQLTDSGTYPGFEASPAMSNLSLDSNSGCKSLNGSLKKPLQNFHSKNLVTERKRRNRIKDGLYALRALVPKITKMDKAAILGDAADYIVELQSEVKQLEDELKDLEEEDLKKKHVPKLEALCGETGQSLPTSQNQCSYTTCEKQPMEAQVEVNQIGRRDFLIKSLCEQTRGGFARMMEAMSSSGLRVVDVNVTTTEGRVLNILRVEANKDISPKKLRESLILATDRAQRTLFRRQKASTMS